MDCRRDHGVRGLRRIPLAISGDKEKSGGLASIDERQERQDSKYLLMSPI